MHEKLSKSNLELNQELENLEKELEEEKSKQSESDNLVRINRILYCYYSFKKKKKQNRQNMVSYLRRRQTILFGFCETKPTFSILSPLIFLIAY